VTLIDLEFCGVALASEADEEADERYETQVIEALVDQMNNIFKVHTDKDRVATNDASKFLAAIAPSNSAQSSPDQANRKQPMSAGTSNLSEHHIEVRMDLPESRLSGRFAGNEPCCLRTSSADRTEIPCLFRCCRHGEQAGR